MIFESKLDNSFMEGQVISDGYHATFGFDQNGNSAIRCQRCHTMLLSYVREDMPINVLHCDFPAAESFYAFMLKLFFTRKMTDNPTTLIKITLLDI